jgi:hypothetical protein
VRQHESNVEELAAKERTIQSLKNKLKEMENNSEQLSFRLREELERSRMF